MSAFQVMLAGKWENYGKEEDRILKRAFMTGFPKARYTHRTSRYEVDFKNMLQRNRDTGKERDIRPPPNCRPPATPIVPAGLTAVINVPAGSPGTTIEIPHPRDPSQKISVKVPSGAHVGQAMLVPVPEIAACVVRRDRAGPSPAEEKRKQGGYSTCTKAVAGGTAAAAVAGVGVAGAAYGEEGVAAATDGFHGFMDHIGGVEGFAAAVDDFRGFTEDLGDLEVLAAAADGGFDDVWRNFGEWYEEASEDVGDYIMDLF